MVIDRLIGGKGEYVLKGKREDGKWEEISLYDRRVAWAEVRYEFDKDLCQDYTHIILYNKKDRKVEWSKRCPSADEKVAKDIDVTKTMMKGMTDVVTQMLALQQSMIAQMTSLQTAIMNLASNIAKVSEQASKEPSLVDQLASYYQMKQVIKLLVEEEGAKSSATELDKLFSFIERALNLGKRVEALRESPAPAQALSSQTPEAVRKALAEAEEKLEKKLLETEEKLDQALAICREVEGEECA